MSEWLSWLLLFLDSFSFYIEDYERIYCIFVSTWMKNRGKHIHHKQPNKETCLLWLTFTLSCISVSEFQHLCLLFHHHVLQPVSQYKSLQKRSPHLKWPSFLPAFRCRSGFGRSRRLLLFHIKKFYLNILGLIECFSCVCLWDFVMNNLF